MGMGHLLVSGLGPGRPAPTSGLQLPRGEAKDLPEQEPGQAHGGQ